MYHLPNEIINLIYEFDSTKYENYNKVLQQLTIKQNYNKVLNELNKEFNKDYDLETYENINETTYKEVISYISSYLKSNKTTYGMTLQGNIYINVITLNTKFYINTYTNYDVFTT